MIKKAPFGAFFFDKLFDRLIDDLCKKIAIYLVHTIVAKILLVYKFNSSSSNSSTDNMLNCYPEFININYLSN